MKNRCCFFFMAVLGGTSGARAAEPADSVQEVIVTAEKRSERIQDVPVPVTALDTQTLAASGLDRIQDYFTAVPGLSLTNSGDGRQTLSIRGLTTGGLNNPTVGVVIDDVPFGSSTAQGLGGSVYPDIDPGDLAGVEVLRGPQGTLYGASSIGGLLKFVTQDPSTQAVSGRVQMLGNDVAHGQLGYGVRGSVNVPVSDTIAIRASAFTRRDPGYIDNITTGENNVNEANTNGARLSALWRPSDDLKLKLSAMIQNTIGNGWSQVDVNSNLQPTYGDLQQARLRGTGAYDLKIQFYTAALSAKLGNLDFQSLTGYSQTRHDDYGDRTPSLGFLSELVLNVAGSGLVNTYPTYKLSQEFRLSSPTGRLFEWLVGAFYTRETSTANQLLLAIEPTTGVSAGLAGGFNFPTQFTERAAFGAFTVNFTDQFNIQFGARESQIDNRFDETDTGPYVPLAFGIPSPNIYPTERTRQRPFTYLVTPQFKVSPDLMLYARLASGYRSGGPNPAASVFHLPLSYDPDKNNNYELGVKTALFDHALTLDLSAYYIQWKHIQLQLLDAASQFQYFSNAGNAKSQGVELSLQAAPARGLKIVATASVNDAELTQDLPAGSSAVGVAGDRLPYSARFSGSLAVDQDFALSGEWIGFAGATLSYTGHRSAEFAASEAERFQLPAYTQVDLRTGIRYDSWSTNLFLNNVSDKRGVLAQDQLSPGAFDVTYIQPRTIGLSVTKVF